MSKTAISGTSVPREIVAGEVTLSPGVSIPCAVLDNGMRVLSTRGVSRAFGSKKTGTDNTKTGAPQPPPFLVAKGLQRFVSEELTALLNSPVVYQPKTGRTAYGYDCAVFPLICKTIVAADREGVLRDNQSRVADAAYAILDALIGVAMIQLIDEATGYDKIRPPQDATRQFQRMLAETRQPWKKTFDDDFYRGICELRGIPYDRRHRPKYFGWLTKDVVYERIAPGLVEALEELNPMGDNGERSARHHQWLSRDVGYRDLHDHLVAVITLLHTSDNWEDFREKLDHVAPRNHRTLYLIPFAQMKPSKKKTG